MLNWFLLTTVLGFQTLPKPHAIWQITFDVSQALVTPQGETVLFDGATVYRYDASGTLQNTATLAFAPARIYLDPEGRVLVHDGDQLLGLLNQENGLVWQRKFPPADLPPIHFQKFLAYPVGKKVWVLDASSSWAKYSLERDQPITALGRYNDDLLIADRQGRLLQWDPLTGRRLWLRSKGKAPVQYLTVAGNQSIALATAEGELEILDDKRKTKWRRQFHIDIASPPLWFDLAEGGQWVLATHGRHFYAFAGRGKQIADHLLPNRPMVLTEFGPALALLLSYQSPQLFWYDVEKRQFQTETLSTYQSLVVDQASCFLMVGADGRIRLYLKPSKAVGD